jgi:hypothetical protein
MKGIEIPCQEIVEWVTDFLEGALSADRHRLFLEHLADCEPCSLYVEQIKITKATLGAVVDEDLSPAAWDALRAAFSGLAKESRS